MVNVIYKYIKSIKTQTLDLGMTTLTIKLKPTQKQPGTTQTINLIHKIKNVNYCLLSKKSAQ